MISQARASWKDSLARFPPKSSSWRTWIPTVLQAGLRGRLGATPRPGSMGRLIPVAEAGQDLRALLPDGLK